MAHLSYFGILLWFSVLEQFTPVPEEAALLSLGYICAHGKLNVFVAGTVSLTGLLIADSVLFFISRKGAAFISRLFLKANPNLVQKLRSDFASHTARTIIISALLPKVRFMSPIVAASSGIPFTRFISVNGAITAIYVVFYIIAGMFFYDQIGFLSFHLKAWRHLIFAVLIALITIVFFIGRSRSKKMGNQK